MTIMALNDDAPVTDPAPTEPEGKAPELTPAVDSPVAPVMTVADLKAAFDKAEDKAADNLSDTLIRMAKIEYAIESLGERIFALEQFVLKVK